MTKKHFELFATEARYWRKRAIQEERDGKLAGSIVASHMSYAIGIEDAVIKVAQLTSKHFDAERFKAACRK